MARPKKNYAPIIATGLKLMGGGRMLDVLVCRQPNDVACDTFLYENLRLGSVVTCPHGHRGRVVSLLDAFDRRLTDLTYYHPPGSEIGDPARGYFDAGCAWLDLDYILRAAHPERARALAHRQRQDKRQKIEAADAERQRERFALVRATER